MSRKFTSILTLLAIAFCLPVHAQFSGEVRQYPSTDYRTSDIEFQLSEVATAMGYASVTDFATIFTSSLRANEEKATFDGAISFICTDSLGAEVSTYTAESGRLGCFWLNKDGKVVEWGDDSYFFNNVRIDSIDNVPAKLVFGLGQYPEHCVAGDAYTATITMTNGTSTSTFALTLAIDALPTVVANLEYAKLNILGTTEVLVQQYPRGTYNADAVSMDMKDAIEALSYPKSVLEASLQNNLYSYQFNKELDVISDSLTNKVTSSSGYWLSRSYDEKTGEYADKCYIDVYGAESKFYIEAFSFNAETDTATFNVGQYPGSLKTGETPYAELFLINGDNAWKFIVKLEIIEEPEYGEVTEVGREEMVITREPSVSGNYDEKTYSLDEAKMIELLGGDPASWIFKHNNNDNHSTNYNTNATGFWMDINGDMCAWGESARVYVDYTAPATLAIGQYPDHNQDGDVFHTIFEIVNEDKAYTVDLTINFKKKDESELPAKTNLATYEVEIQSLEHKGYETATSEAIDVNAIYEIIGTTSPSYYTLAVPDSGSVEVKYTNVYSCTPYPGFWYTKDGYQCSWGADAYFGLTYSAANGTFDLYQFPDNTAIGNSYNTKWFFVNDETGAMVTVKVNVAIVEELIEREIVGKDEIAVNIGNGEEEAYATADLNEALTLLGAADANDFYENGTLLAAVNSSSFGGSDLYDEAEGFWFDANGYVIDPSNEEQLENQTFSVNLVVEADGTATITTYCLVPPAPGKGYYTRLALNMGSKRFIVTIALGDEEFITTINEVSSERTNANVYDLSGRMVRKNASNLEGLNKGIYIHNGKKVVLK